ncbi:helix-turn-helix domain-containing protein [Pararhodobacter oceanensis]|uniref:helix-turn-helix domain-containing protein n=1 Tax=Pararhodobacter oceanensis TaxID=2172121 RepID=UPI003A92058F
MDDWAIKIRTSRKAKGLTQGEYASLLGVDITTVSRWERGLVVPSPSVQRTLARLQFARGVDNHPVIRAILRPERVAVAWGLHDQRYLKLTEGHQAHFGQSATALLGKDIRHTTADWAVEAMEKQELLRGFRDGYLLGVEWQSVEIVRGAPVATMRSTFPVDITRFDKAVITTTNIVDNAESGTFNFITVDDL